MSRGLLLLCLTCLALATDKSGLEYLKEWNAFFHHDFTSSKVDVQGRLAAGGDVKLSHFEVGTLMPKNCKRADLAVGGDLVFNDGSVCCGEIITTGNATLNVVTHPCPAIQGPTGVPFDKAFEELIATSTYYGSLPPNGAVDRSYQKLSFTGSSPNVTYFSVDGSDLEGITELDITIPEGGWATINVNGKSVKMTDVTIKLAPTTNRSKVLVNFFEATSLTMSGISVEGSILAPQAHVQFDNGNINGALCGTSYNGTAEFHHHPYQPPCGPCPPCPACIKIVDLPDFALFVRENVNMSSVDCQGRMAVGNNAKLYNYAVATKLTPQHPPIDTLLVSGDLNYDVGAVDTGNIVYGKSAELTAVGHYNGEVIHRDPVGIDWDKDFEKLYQISDNISAMKPNGDVLQEYATLMTLRGTDNVSIFKTEIPANVSNIQIDVPPNGYALITVIGKHPALKSLYMSGTNATPVRTLWNFPEAETLILNTVGVLGTVLAPHANITFTNGHVDGSIFCNNLVGNGETHNFSFIPITKCPPCKPCPPCPPPNASMSIV
eukprot:TRINITY_DN8534_c0_g1_i1.p1 TRINITY_DN8534_c0_g1~~TRINITY_DN8534_c0_g1_i1.p1  ORF type:complete len:564 (+),score=166.09 TRINITY_DN8534_c0_g1_i1:49-1692(+)